MSHPPTSVWFSNSRCSSFYYFFPVNKDRDDAALESLASGTFIALHVCVWERERAFPCIQPLFLLHLNGSLLHCKLHKSRADASFILGCCPYTQCVRYTIINAINPASEQTNTVQYRCRMHKRLQNGIWRYANDQKPTVVFLMQKRIKARETALPVRMQCERLLHKKLLQSSWN